MTMVGRRNATLLCDSQLPRPLCVESLHAHFDASWRPNEPSRIYVGLPPERPWRGPRRRVTSRSEKHAARWLPASWEGHAYAMERRVSVSSAAWFLRLSLIATGNARAAGYPDHPVRIIVGYPAGGSTDIVARIIGNWLSQKLGQQFIVENKPGAGNNIGTELVTKAAPDGYTLLLVNPANTINATLYKKLNFVFLRDIDPVANVIQVPNVMEVNPSVPVKTVAEFIAYVKANPDKINVASSGNGTSIHLSGELFKMMTGVKMTHVPYKGSAPMLTDLLGGQVQVTFDNLPSSIAHIRAGKLRALAVTTAKRSPELPDVPTVADTVPGLRSRRLLRLRRAAWDAEGDRRSAQQGDQRGAQGSRHPGQAQGSRRHSGARLAGRFRQVPRQRNRQMGKGCARRQSVDPVTLDCSGRSPL